MPTVIAHELVGVQAMSGPVGQISTLRIRYSDTVPAGGTGVGAGTKHFHHSISLHTIQVMPLLHLLLVQMQPLSKGVAGNRLSVQMSRKLVEARLSSSIGSLDNQNPTAMRLHSSAST